MSKMAFNSLSKLQSALCFVSYRRGVGVAGATFTEAHTLVERWLHWDKDEASRAYVSDLLAAGKLDVIYDLLHNRLEFGKFQL